MAVSLQEQRWLMLTNEQRGPVGEMTELAVHEYGQHMQILRGLGMGRRELEFCWLRFLKTFAVWN